MLVNICSGVIVMWALSQQQVQSASQQHSHGVVVMISAYTFQVYWFKSLGFWCIGGVYTVW
jgi:hypothetical protein